MPWLWNEDFRDEAAASLYPFADGASLASADGAIAIDPATFLDAAVYPIGGAASCALTAVDAASRLVTLWVGDSALPRRASASFDPLLPPGELPLADAYGRPAGLLLADPALLAASQAWPPGTYAFAAPFAASCVVPTPEVGVRGFVTPAGDLLTGDVWWVGENGVVVRDDGGAIRIDVVGDPLFARRLCEPLGQFETPRFVRTINGVPPGPDGDFHVAAGSHGAADTILRVYPVGAGRVAVEVVGRVAGGP